MTTLLAFLLTLGVLIVIHEWGHYRTAVACGVKVLRFSVGFGPVLWRRQKDKDSTEFVLCALPLGGYVRMLDEREGLVAAHEVNRAFNRQSLAKRAAIVAAGPVANLVLAVMLYGAAHWIGVDEVKAVLGPPAAGSVAERAGLRAGDWVRAVASDGEGQGDSDWAEVRSMSDLRWRLTQAALEPRDLRLQVSDRDGRGNRTVRVPLTSFEPREVDGDFVRKLGLASEFREPVLGEVVAGGPAAVAGLLKGDRVLAIDGKPIIDAMQTVQTVRAAVREGRGVTQRWTVDRAGRTMEFEVTPKVVTDKGTAVGRVEVQPGQAPTMVNVRYGPIDGLLLGAQRTWEISVLTVRMIGRMLIGEASLKNLSGPITIADFAGKSVEKGLAYYLGFLALVSVSLGVLNLLPLPMLDGGHLMYYIFEAVTGRPVSDAWLARLQRGGIVVLLMMMSVALYNDVARLLGLH